MTTATPPTKKLFLNGVLDGERWQRLLHRSGREISAKCWELPQLLNLKGNAKRVFLAVLAATSFATCVHAQSNASGPLVTVSGELQFVRDDRDFVAMLDKRIFDRFGANTLTHFDDVSNANDAVTRTLVQTDSGPVLYDFRRHPPLVQRSGRRMTVKRVFWQGDEVVMQGSQGWFRFVRGELTKLQSSTTTYH
jgi:hypothetical protein